VPDDLQAQIVSPTQRILLTKFEEDVIVEHILKLFDRGFAPRLAAVADMANSLRTERNMGYTSPVRSLNVDLSSRRSLIANKTIREPFARILR
jgi:hypothetical protein